MMNIISRDLCVAVALVGFISVHAVGEEPVWITEGNVDPNGNVTWPFESGKKYILADNLSRGLRIEGVENITVSLNGFKIQGDWDVARIKGTSCRGLDENTCGNMSECKPFYSCEGGDSTLSCAGTIEYYCNSPEYPKPGCTWNSQTSECEGYESCSSLADYDCPAIGCSNGAYWDCLGTFNGTYGIRISICRNVNISGGRILGFSTGVQVAGSSDITLFGITSIGLTRGISIQSSFGIVDINDSIFGAAKGDAAASLLATQNGSVFLDKCVFVGGKTVSNSKSIVFIDSEFEPTDTSVFTEVRKGVEISRAVAGLPADFNMNAFVSYLADSGVIMFGTDWCGYCKKQRERFGETFREAIFFDCTMIEGDEKGNGEKKAVMTELGIKSFPTWIIDEKLYPGLKSIAELVSLSGYGRE